MIIAAPSNSTTVPRSMSVQALQPARGAGGTLPSYLVRPLVLTGSSGCSLATTPCKPNGWSTVTVEQPHLLCDLSTGPHRAMTTAIQLLLFRLRGEQISSGGILTSIREPDPQPRNNRTCR